MPKLG